MTAIGKQTYTFRDVKGQVARSAFWLTYDPAEAAPDAWNVGSALATALTNASNARLIAASGPYGVVNTPGYGVQADYPDCEDRAEFSVLSAAGVIHHFGIPAPKAALFMADGQTVSASSALVIAFISALATAQGDAKITGRNGDVFTGAPAGLVGGQRMRKRLQRKMSIWTLSGGLTQPAE